MSRIEKIVKSYDFYSNRIDDGGQHRAAVQKNKAIFAELEKLGVTAIAKDGVPFMTQSFKDADKKDIKYV